MSGAWAIRLRSQQSKGGDELKKWRYSAGMKAVALLTHQCLITVLALCIMMLIMLFLNNILNFNERSDILYPDTDYFAQQFESTAAEILEYTDLRRKFETNGSYDADKRVDIWQYYDNQEIQGNATDRKKEKALSYRLGDLAEWSRGYATEPLEFVSECYLDNGLQQGLKIYRNGEAVFSEEKAVESLDDLAPELRGRIIEEVEHFYGGSYSVNSGEGWTIMPDKQTLRAISDSGAEEGSGTGLQKRSQDRQGQEIIQKVIAGKLFELEKSELEWLLNDMELGFVTSSFESDYVCEDFLPADGKGIWEMFLQGDCSIEYMQNACRALEFTLDNLGKEISRYRKGVNKYSQEARARNVYYCVVRGKEKNIYTNIKNSTGLDPTSLGEKLGKYIIYRESDGHLETNVKGMDDYFYERIEPAYIDKGSALYVGVDTAFPHDDSFREAKLEYSSLHPWIRICLWGAVVSFLAELICLIYLSIVAGKRDDTGEVYLNFFDRIPTEFLLLVSSVLIVFFVFGLGSIWTGYDGGDFVGLLLLSCGMTFLAMSVLLVFYLSFVRRIRAGVFWHHSILRWFVHGIGLAFTNRKSSTKMLVWFVLHLLACLLILPTISMAYDRSVFTAGTACFALLCGVEAVLIIREGVQRSKVMEGISKIASGDLEYKVEEGELKGDNKKLAQAVNAIGEGLHRAVDESMKNERLQADLITNVSHDIKTPLTSIINYVDLLKREDLQNERAQNYIKVLDSKSQRLKQLAEDLVEASRISSGNINLEMIRINLVELVHQTEGEFAERFEERGLTVVSHLPAESVVILADGRRIWRVLENLYQNVAKYAMEQTRVYVDLQTNEDQVLFSIKNISKNPLNIAADELTERFIRGDISRSTEGSGLGLSIAQNLTTLMGGTFQIYLDGDLFKVMIGFQRER